MHYLFFKSDGLSPSPNSPLGSTSSSVFSHQLSQQHQQLHLQQRLLPTVLAIQQRERGDEGQGGPLNFVGGELGNLFLNIFKLI